jgi:hypothetical protein
LNGREVSRDEYLAFIRRFPERVSTRTGICEPPQEQCHNGGELIGRIVLADPQPRRYYIKAE